MHEDEETAEDQTCVDTPLLVEVITVPTPQMLVRRVEFMSRRAERWTSG